MTEKLAVEAKSILAAAGFIVYAGKECLPTYCRSCYEAVNPAVAPLL